MVIEADKDGVLALALILSALTAFCWWKVLYKPGANWGSWSAAACVGMILSGASFVAWSLL